MQRRGTLSRPRLRSRRGLRADRPVTEFPEVLVRREDFPARTLEGDSSPMRRLTRRSSTWPMPGSARSYVGCLLLNTAIGIDPTLVPFTGGAAGNECADGGPGRLLLRSDHRPVGPDQRRQCACSSRIRRCSAPSAPGRRASRGACRSSNIAPFFALFAPKGTPQSVVDVLAAALNQTLDDPVASKRFAPELAPRSPRRAGVVLHRSMRWSEARLRG